ncbi:MAG: nickel pincer cofactor-dependent isomerase, group 22 [Chloroflexota bacterium]
MDLPTDLPMPKLYKIRQALNVPAVEDIPGAVRSELERIGIAKLVKPGQRIALTAGSRGVVNIVTVLKTVADVLKEHGAEPFVVPTMGSHGGATPEGQREVLRGLGVTEETVGVPILSSLEVVQIGKTKDGTPVYIDKNASQADGILVVARVKPHTDFEGPIESGLFKMMTIGLGKHKGALAAHRLAMTKGFQYAIPAVGAVVLKEAPIVCGLALVENAYDQTAKVQAVPKERFEADEVALLELAKRLLARLPMDTMDILVVDEIGKDVTGAGMDPNVVGRIMNRASPEPELPKITRIIARGLTAATHGNAIGVGKADFITRRMYEQIDLWPTYINAVTGGAPEAGRIAMICEHDKQALVFAMTTIGDKDEKNVRLMWIRNSLELEEVLVSEAMLPDVKANPKLEVVGGPVEIKFQADGYIEEFFSKRVPGAAH